jgi:hypothetical protein
MLDEAGFVDVAVHDVPDDPFDSVYVARTRTPSGGPGQSRSGVPSQARDGA